MPVDRSSPPNVALPTINVNLTAASNTTSIRAHQSRLRPAFNICPLLHHSHTLIIDSSSLDVECHCPPLLRKPRTLALTSQLHELPITALRSSRGPHSSKQACHLLFQSTTNPSDSNLHHERTVETFAGLWSSPRSTAEDHCQHLRPVNRLPAIDHSRWPALTYNPARGCVNLSINSDNLQSKSLSIPTLPAPFISSKPYANP